MESKIITAYKTQLNTAGLELKNVRHLPVMAQVEILDADTTQSLLATLAGDAQEAAGPITDTGLPRMLKITAWIAHSGPANRNGDAFLGEDLQEVVGNDLFAPPYLGMVDFNHDFNPYGAWYSARYEYDPKAGEFGIVAEGTIFAWRFTEMADKVLAEQSRNGSVAVSMACIPQGLEYRQGDDGRDETVLRKPVFLATSILDVLPADPHGRGVGSEREDSTQEDRYRDLNMALLTTDQITFVKWDTSQAFTASGNSQENTMDTDKIIEQVTEAMGEKAGEFVAELKEAVADAARVPALEATIADLTAQLEAVSTKVADAEANVEAKDAELEAANTALEAKLQELSEVTEMLETFEALEEAREEAEEATRVAELKTERLDALGNTYITILDTKSEEIKEKVIAHIVEMSEEEFEAHKSLYGASSNDSNASYGDRSRAEGTLVTPAGTAGSGWAIDKYFNNR